MWFFFAIFYPCGYDLHLLDVEILSEPEEVPPVVINQKRVNTSIENLLDYRPITLRNEKERAIFQIQARICQAFREFLDGQEPRAELISSPCHVSANRHIWRRARSFTSR